jgi:hypothetical protein
MLHTSGIRSRVNCSPAAKDSAQNRAPWVITYDLSNKTAWDASANPDNVTKGYWTTDEFAIRGPYSLLPAFCPPTSSQQIGGGRWSWLEDTHQTLWPPTFHPWPINFTANWLYGSAQSGFHSMKNTSLQTDPDLKRLMSTCGARKTETFPDNFALYNEIPTVRSLTCRPIVETAEAQVTVHATGRVLNYTILERPVLDDGPWKNAFAMFSHNSSLGREQFVQGPYNVTTPSVPKVRPRYLVS